MTDEPKCCDRGYSELTKRLAAEINPSTAGAPLSVLGVAVRSMALDAIKESARWDRIEERYAELNAGEQDG